MRALCRHGKKDIRCDTVPDPKIEAPGDAIVRVTSCAICGSDLHLYDGFVPGMESGDIMGHEFMGEVVEVGSENKKLKVGDRVVLPFTIICGECEQCRRGNFSVCERSNRNKDMADKVFGHTTAGLFGYTHLTGGYPGGQAEYVRVPFADVGPVKVSNGLTDEQVLFLGDIFPTGWQAVRHRAHRHGGDLGLRAGRPVLHPQRDPARRETGGGDRQRARAALDGAGGRRHHDQLRRGERRRAAQRAHRRQGAGEVHRCRRHGGACDRDARFDLRPGQAGGDAGDRPSARAAGDDVRLPAGRRAVGAGCLWRAARQDPVRHGHEQGLTIRTGQTHVNRWTDDLLRRIEEGQIDPSFVITHRVGLQDGPEMYETFRDKQDGCVKVVLRP